jgi:uncharacterized protein YndB with AHSA1/START domain
MSTDVIEKKVLLKAPLERVWSAISNSAEFGSWFGMKIDGPFVAGAPVAATIAQTTADPEVAKHQEGHVGLRFELLVERIEPRRLFSFRWHPFAVDKAMDYSSEPTTLVAFALEEVSDGIMLTITESGFDSIPLERRAQAFKSNEQGWAIQTTLIAKYLARETAA